jgi:hypothetical protein
LSSESVQVGLSQRRPGASGAARQQPAVRQRRRVQASAQPAWPVSSAWVRSTTTASGTMGGFPVSYMSLIGSFMAFSFVVLRAVSPCFGGVG